MIKVTYLSKGGCGSTQLEIMVDKETNTFVLTFRDHWMSMKTPETVSLSGTVSQVATNTLWLTATSMTCNDNDVSASIKRSDYSLINMHLYMLLEEHQFQHDDDEIAFALTGNGVTNSNWTYNCLLQINSERGDLPCDKFTQFARRLIKCQVV